MFRSLPLRLFLLAGCATALLTGKNQAQNTAIGSTEITDWKDGKSGAFMLMFDDNCKSQIANVIPQLRERNLASTFYPNPGKGEWKASSEFWEREAPSVPGLVYGNHTLTHQGYLTVEQAAEDLKLCNEKLNEAQDKNSPRLISFAKPGVAAEKWQLTPEQLEQLLQENHLVARPLFDGHGAAVHLKNAADVLALADAASRKGTAEYVIFHGVGGDWFAFDKDEFVVLLDGLVERKETLWITDHISLHKYEVERKSARVESPVVTGDTITLQIKSDTDPALFDQPLTVRTVVPAAWLTCKVQQGATTIVVPVKNGVAQYEALPNGPAIVLKAAS